MRPSGAARLLLVALALGLGVACGGGTRCTSADQELSTAGAHTLTCGVAERAPQWIELLAGRPLPAAEEQRAISAVKEQFDAAPGPTLAWLDQVARAGRELEQASGLEGAERRSELVWQAQADQGLIASDRAALFSVQKGALSVWATDDTQRLALTEADVEGWIYLASLCREVQGGGPLRISVADRVTVYRMVQERFAEGPRAQKIALASVGAVWNRVKNAWQVASYETQQEWIRTAPLPPPMTASSLGYAGAVLDGDLTGLAASVHDVLGPLRLARTGDPFQEADPQ